MGFLFLLTVDKVGWNFAFHPPFFALVSICFFFALIPASIVV